MRNLKRALSLVMAMALIVGMMVVGASAASYEDFTDKDEIQNTEAVQTLVALNVINGKDNGSYDPTGSLTRAEMAKLITYVLNGGSEPVLGTKVNPTYSDIKGHWAEAYIEYCTSMNIIAGDGAGRFNPANTLTGSQAAKMLLVAMGYNADVFGFTGNDWEINVNREANSAGLYDGLEGIVASQVISRDDVAQMIYNALQAPMMVRTWSQDKTTGAITEIYELAVDKNGVATKSLLSDKFGALIWIGTYVANSDTRSGLKDGYIVVEGKLNTDDSDTVKEASFPYDLAISNIGEEIKVLFKDGTGGTANKPDGKDVIYGAYNTGNTEVVNTTKDGISSSYTTAGKIKVDGTVYNVAEATNDAAVAIVRNYGALDDVMVDADGTAQTDLSKAAPLFKTYKAAFEALSAQSGDTVKFVLNEDGEIFRAYVVESNLTKVTSISSTKITMAGVGAIEIEDNDVAEGLSTNDIVVYTKLYDADKDDAYFTVAKAETVEGEITGYTGTEKVSIEGTSYKIAGKKLIDNLTDDSMASLSGEIETNVIAYLVNGMVAAIDKNDETASSYALVVGTNNTDTSDKDMKEGKVKLLLSDNTTATYVVDEDSKLQLQTDSVAAGTLIKYSLNSDDTVEISAKVSDNANTTKVWNNDTKIVADKAVAAADAVLYVSTSSTGDYKAYDMRSLKTLTLSGAKDVYYVTNNSGKITAAYVDLQAVPSGATSDTLYGMIIANNGVVKIDDTYYCQFVVWTGEETTVNVKGQTSSLSKGDYVYFDESNDGTYAASDVKSLASFSGGSVVNAAVKEYSTSDRTLSYYTDLYEDMDGNTYTGKTLKTAAMDDDAVIIYVDRDGKKAGDEIGVSAFDTSTGYANVKVVLDSNGVILAMLVETSGECDIDGNKTPLNAEQAITLPTAETTQAGVKVTATPDKTKAYQGDEVTYTVTVSGTSEVGAANDTITLALTNLTGADTLAGSGTNCTVSGLVITITADSQSTAGTFTVKGTVAGAVTADLTGAAV